MADESEGESREGRRRVKLYQLNDSGQWDDKGTGHVVVSFEGEESADSEKEEKDGDVDAVAETKNDASTEKGAGEDSAGEAGVEGQDKDSKAAEDGDKPRTVKVPKKMSFVVQSEGEEKVVLLESTVLMDDIYQRQGETLILWCEPTTGNDMALSFQEPEGSQELWVALRNFQGRPLEEEATEDDTVSQSGQPPLPPAEYGTLEELAHALSVLGPFDREEAVNQIQSEKYLEKLAAIFHSCEDMEDSESLLHLYHIMKSIVSLNNLNLLETILSDEYLYDAMGMLEYDPERPGGKADFRQFLKDRAVFKEIVPFQNDSITNSIHQNFRINYLKDVVLARVLEDSTFQILTSMVFYNNREILMHITDDGTWLKKVFEKLHSLDLPHGDWKNLVMLLQELLNLTKTVQQLRLDLLRKMCEQGLFHALERACTDDDIAVRHSAADMFNICVQHEPFLLRSFIKTNPDTLNTLIHCSCHDPDSGLISQFGEIVRNLVDREVGSILASVENDEFFNLFYEKHLSKYLEVFQDTFEAKNRSFVRTQTCDLLAFCVSAHSYRSRNFVIKHNVLDMTLKLMTLQDKPYTLAAIRLFRSWMALKDPTCNRVAIRSDLFDPVVAILEENGCKYNLINSAILELFDMLLKDKARMIIQYLATRFRDAFSEIKYVPVFRQILKLDDDFTGTPANPLPANGEAGTSSKTPGYARRRTAYHLKRLPGDDEDEAYLNEPDEDEEVLIVSGTTSSDSSSSSTGDRGDSVVEPTDKENKDVGEPSGNGIGEQVSLQCEEVEAAGSYREAVVLGKRTRGGVGDEAAGEQQMNAENKGAQSGDSKSAPGGSVEAQDGESDVKRRKVKEGDV